MMRIAILSRYQKTANRGAESVVSELQKRLVKKFQVDIFSGEDSDNLDLVLNGNYDVVMPTNGRSQSLKVSMGRLKRPYKVVIGGHSGIGRDDIWNIAVCKPDVFIALTNYMADWAKKWAWGSRVVKIPNGVDLEKFNPNGKKFEVDLPGPIILSVGALTWYKHHERVIEAVAGLKTGSLLIVGKGEEKEALEELASEKIPNRFKIISVEYEQMPSVFRAADLFTLPSWDREAFGVVYLEAMATGKPVVAPKDKSRKEIVGEAGILVDTSNISNYTSAIQEALVNKWGNTPREQAEKFSWDKVALEYEKLFEEICKK